MEGNRKSCFDQLRHKNVSSIDDLKLKLRKLYIADLKSKRNRILNNKRDIGISEEDELEFYRKFCRIHFGQFGDPWDAEEDLLSRIWEEIKIEEIEGDKSDLLDGLLDTYLGQQSIICPVCLRLPIAEVSGNVSCDCGFQLPLPPNMDVKDFENLVMTCSELHNADCEAIPTFRAHKDATEMRFTLTCERCEMESVILESKDAGFPMDP